MERWLEIGKTMRSQNTSKANYFLLTQFSMLPVVISKTTSHKLRFC